MQEITMAAVLSVCAGLAAAGAPGPDPERDIQFSSVDFQTSVLELRNYGDATIALDGWRCCSHSNAQVRRYTSPSALNGVTLEPEESMFIYMNNDAPAGNLNFDASDLGQFASNFGQGPYAIQLYWPNGGSLSFESNEDMVDHVQWSVNGVHNNVADERSQQAVNAGLWTEANVWIATSGNSLFWSLTPDGGLLHGPGDYEVGEPPMGCNDADLAEPFGVLDLNDINVFIGAFQGQDPAADLAPPAGIFDLADVQAFVSAFGAGCP